MDRSGLVDADRIMNDGGPKGPFDIRVKSKGTVLLDLSSDVFVKHEKVVWGSFAGLKKVSFGSLGCTFEHCDFRNMRPSQIVFSSGREQSRYISCNFDGSRFDHIIAGQSRFENCSFRNVTMNRLFTHAAEFIGCTFSGVLKSSVFFGKVTGNFSEDTKRRTNELLDNDFADAQFVDVGFRLGVDLLRQRLPSGSEYVYLRGAAKALHELRNRYVQATHSPRREAVFHLLKSLEEDVEAGQTQLFLCKSSEADLDAGAVDAIWEELRGIDQQMSRL